jgi:hypothetical protein
MRLEQVERLLKSLALKQVHLPVMLVSEAGLGKSSVVKQVAADLKIACIDLRLATQEAGDLIGMPRIIDGKTTWAMPHWWPEIGTKGILFLDELNRAPTEVRQCIFQLLTDWKMHEHTLPEGWIIVSAINPDGTKSGYQVEGLDPSMINRMDFINVELSVEGWLTWAHTVKLHPAVIGYISANKLMLHKVKESGPFPSPRTWEYVSRLLQAEAHEENTLTDLVTGLVGPEAGAQFCQWMRKNYEKPVSAEEVLDGYTKDVVAKVRAQSRSANNATAIELATLLTAIHKANKRLTDKQGDAVRKFAMDLGGYGDKNSTQKHDDVIVAFLKRIPSPQLSLEIICSQTPEAEKLALLFNEINKATEITPAKKTK